MKDKIMGLIKQPLIWVMVGSILLAVIFGVAASLSVVQVPEAVKEFCAQMEHFEEKEFNDFLEKQKLLTTTQYHSRALYVDALEAYLKPDTYKLECTYGCPYEEDDVLVVPVTLNLYLKDEQVSVNTMSIYIREMDGQQVITKVWLPIGVITQ